MSIQDRVAMIIKANNLSASQFADKIGVQRSSLSHVLNGRNKPSLDFLSKIITSFPKVNASWLITGEVREEGESMISDNGKENKKSKAVTSNQVGTKPERIVMFFKDGTYKEYFPSNDQ